MTDTPAPSGLPLGERLSDKCNPILLRELQQMFGGKAFTATIVLVMLAVFLIALTIMLQREDMPRQPGRDVFVAVMMVLAPILLLVLPMQAFNSMQFELREGAIDQLLMSDLKPRQIVRGKMQAAALVIFAFLGAFAPLLAMTYLLRGIDVTTIALALGLGVLAALAASSLGMAMGAVTAIKPLQQIARVGVSLGLGAITVGAMAGLFELVSELSRASARFEWEPFVAIGLAFVIGIVLTGMIAAAVLTHPYENRSTPFRVLPFVVGALAIGLLAWLVEVRYFDEACPVVAVIIMICGIPFLMGAVTEAPALSPRVRTLVPRNRGLALLAAPFLPGGDRGFLFVLAFLGMNVVVAGLLPWLHGVLPRRNISYFVGGLACYLIIYMSVMRTLRGGGQGQRPRIRGIVGTILLLVLACAVPLVHDIARFGHVRWNWAHLLNPFFTISEFESRAKVEVLLVLAAFAALFVVLRLPGMWRGVREVLEASRARAR